VPQDEHQSGNDCEQADDPEWNGQSDKYVEAENDQEERKKEVGHVEVGFRAEAVWV